MNRDERYMQRCLHLASMGGGWVAPNPLVGAVLVYGDRIIGEGWHQRYGGPHAEVHCISSVLPENQSLIPDSTLYVSLEPCSHYGKTPPCCELIIRMGIKKVVIGCEDPFPKVNGKGVERLRKEGVEVIIGILSEECRELNRRFLLFHEKQRPYVVLKWAQTADGYMGSDTDKRLHISGSAANRLVHRWRGEEAAILIGSNTALLDDPLLTNRWTQQPQPLRLVVDRNLRLPSDLRLFTSEGGAVYLLNERKEAVEGRVHYKKINPEQPFVESVLNVCYDKQIQSILVEGGRKILDLFLESGLWDEVRIITSVTMNAGGGLKAPMMQDGELVEAFTLPGDSIEIYRPCNHQSAYAISDI